MNEIEFLTAYPSLIGEDSFWLFFSAEKIKNHFKISAYAARKLVKSLLAAGLVTRIANQYALTITAQNVAYMLKEALELKKSREAK